ITDRREPSRMIEYACHEMPHISAQAEFMTIVKEYIRTFIEQGHVEVHSISVNAIERLRHERHMHMVFACNRLCNKFECLYVVAGSHRICIFEADFMLARAGFVV